MKNLHAKTVYCKEEKGSLLQGKMKNLHAKTVYCKEEKGSLLQGKNEKPARQNSLLQRRKRELAPR